jgi:hypothetical protein
MSWKATTPGRGLLAIALVAAASSHAEVVPRALEALAAGADLIVIGIAGPAQPGQLGAIAVEETLKGRAPKRVVVLPALDPDFICDVTSLEPGRRTLFLLTAARGGFRIMHFGRGAFRLAESSVDVEWPKDFVQTKDFRDACRVDPTSHRAQCRLDDVRRLVATFKSPPRNSALVFSEDERTVVIPANEVSCVETSQVRRGLVGGCTTGGLDAGRTPPPLRGLLECWKNRWCMGEASNRE